MENLNLIKPEKVQNIINKFCYTIGMLPTSYKISLTYEEQIIVIGNYLETTIYPALNNNAEALSELYMCRFKQVEICGLRQSHDSH